MKNGDLKSELTRGNSLLGDGGILDTDGDGDTVVEIPEEIIVSEFQGGFVLVYHDEISGNYAIVNRQEFRDTVSKDAQFAFPGAVLGTLSLGAIGAPVGHTVGAWVGHIRHEEIMDAIGDHEGH